MVSITNNTYFKLDKLRYSNMFTIRYGSTVIHCTYMHMCNCIVPCVQYRKFCPRYTQETPVPKVGQTANICVCVDDRWMDGWMTPEVESGCLHFVSE